VAQRNSATQQTSEFGDKMRSRRVKLGLSQNEVARRARINPGTFNRIERGLIAKPSARTLRGLGEALGIPTADLFAWTDTLSPADLPNFRPYMRAKYGALPGSAIKELQREFDRIAAKYGTCGPKPGEDEQ